MHKVLICILSLTFLSASAMAATTVLCEDTHQKLEIDLSASGITGTHWYNKMSSGQYGSVVPFYCSKGGDNGQNLTVSCIDSTYGEYYSIYVLPVISNNMGAFGAIELRRDENSGQVQSKFLWNNCRVR